MQAGRREHCARPEAGGGAEAGPRVRLLEEGNTALPVAAHCHRQVYGAAVLLLCWRTRSMEGPHTCAA